MFHKLISLGTARILSQYSCHGCLLDVVFTQIGNNFDYLHGLHFSAWYYFCYAIY